MAAHPVSHALLSASRILRLSSPVRHKQDGDQEKCRYVFERIDREEAISSPEQRAAHEPCLDVFAD